jgi:DNA-binding GntR family transcriptional regulator
MPTMTVPTDSETVSAIALQVAEVLRERIVRGVLNSGDRIVERKVSAELNISRTPIREALKLLAADGLIQISRNRGAQVTSFSSEEAIWLFDVIAVIEGLAARRLAETVSPGTLEVLEKLHVEMVFHYRRSQIQPYFDANTRIHDLVIERCGNPVLASNHRRMMLMAQRGRFMAIMSPDRWAQSVKEHEELMIALRNRDPEAASEAWGRHLRHTGETLAEVIAAEPARLVG